MKHVEWVFDSFPTRS